MSGQRKGGWGSFLGTAVAGLESRLDTILADDDQASARARAAEAAAKQEAAEKAAAAEKRRLQVDQGGLQSSLLESCHISGGDGRIGKQADGAGVSRSSSRSRPSSRLQDRLAKAVNKGKDGESRPSSEIGSRPESPALKSPGIVSDAGRSSFDSKVSERVTEGALVGENETPDNEETKVDPSPRLSAEAPLSSPPPSSIVSEQPLSTTLPTMSIPTILTPQTSSPRQSLDSIRSRPSVEISTPAEPETTRDAEVLAAELSTLEKTHEETLREHREELNSHLERIDALQSKLTYLSQQLASSAKAASSGAEATPADKKLAEKDAQIAALMEEGQKLSKTEMKHLGTIKKMRTKAQETDKEIDTLKLRLSKAEKSIREQTDRAKRAEASEKAAQEKLKVVARIEKDIELIREEREEAGLTIAELRRQLNDALTRAEDAEKRVQAGALEAEKRVTASLKEDMENMRIEKKLVEDRAKRELQEAKEEAKRQQERAKVAELELRGEIAVILFNRFSRCTQANAEVRISRANLSSSAAAPRKSHRQQPATPKRSFSAKSKPCRLNMLLLPRTGKESRAH